MGYDMPATRNGHNMYEIASLLQKAIRRGDYKLAGYAASELYVNYRGVMWNRMITISCEDCFGIFTKELIRLRKLDDKERRSGAHPIPHVTRAIALLCSAKKSRDACYFVCNFIASPNVRDEIIITEEDKKQAWKDIKSIPAKYFDYEALSSDNLKKEDDEEYKEISLFDLCDNPVTEYGDSAFEMAALLKKSILRLDMENLGYALDCLRFPNRNYIWQIFLSMSMDNGHLLDKEIIALYLADLQINGKKPDEKKDEIFMGKAAMLLCYQRFGLFESLLANKYVDPDKFMDFSEYTFEDIQTFTIDEIPDYVYDVHTIKGKKMGKTDWEMNLVEQAALNPLEPAFFDEASWYPRYEFKHDHNMCSEKEWQACLEYSKNREGNPVKKIPENT